jgi:hypothetical protein
MLFHIFCQLIFCSCYFVKNRNCGNWKPFQNRFSMVYICRKREKCKFLSPYTHTPKIHTYIHPQSIVYENKDAQPDLFQFDPRPDVPPRRVKTLCLPLRSSKLCKVCPPLRVRVYVRFLWGKQSNVFV